MQKMLKLAVFALCYSPLAFAQEVDSLGQTGALDDAAFTFTEAQLGEDDDMSQNVTILSSNTNVYASEVGFLFSPVRFRYRALNQKYNDIYVNGAPMNDMESGQFRYSNIGGINNLTNYNKDATLPFEENNYTMTDVAGSNNYNFRASRVSQGNRLTISGANRSYMLRGMYTFGTGITSGGWAVAGSVGYRWAKRGYVEGTFYNSLSYYFGVQKITGNHSIAFSTWGNPTERASQGAGTDESYWIANNYQYNPYWGYQNGKVRSSRIVNDFAPSAVLTWDWDIDRKTKLTTSLHGKYSMYKSTRLNYNNADNPQPDYWKNLPSSYYDVWDSEDYNNRTAQGLADFYTAYDYLKGSKAARQIDWDRLYAANRNAAIQGSDAMYYVEAKHNDNIYVTLSSILHRQLTNKSSANIGVRIGANKGMHYKTMDDLLGATQFNNINNYALGNYGEGSDAVQYDLNHPNAIVKVDDRFGYDYNLMARRGVLWGNYTENFGVLHYSVSGKLNYDDMQRDGRMRNGMFADHSYGKSETAKFLSGGGKFNGHIDLGGGSNISLGIGYEHRAPQITTAFVSPEMNNDFVANLRNERIFSSEVGYQYQNSLLHFNINAYYNYFDHLTEWQNFYFDDINSFSYVSMTDIRKRYYGVEAGVNFKVTSAFNVKLIGTVSEAENTNNARVRYMISTKAAYVDDKVFNKGMHEAGTPLTAGSVILEYHSNGWFIDLSGNYYDRIYLSYSPSYRYERTLITMATDDPTVINNDGTYNVPAQAKGKGGFMLDGSLGKVFRLRHGKQINLNLSVTNILNNQKICTGGYEQSRSDYTVKDENGQTTVNNVRAYKFSKNPKKFYAYGINGMLNLVYRF